MGGSRSRPRWGRLGLGLVLVVALLYAAVGWYASGEIIAGMVVAPYERELLDVLELTDDAIVLDVTGAEAIDADRDAVMGLEWDGGYAQLGPSEESDGVVQTRSFTLLDGDPPPVGESVVEFDTFAFPGDPSSVGLDFETITYPSELGELEAWYLPGDGSTWLIAVHGLGSDRREFLRSLDAIGELRYPTLVVTYRNDPGAPSTEGNLILMGQEAWRDVGAAVDVAVDRGASDVVLIGPSMGGALSLSFAMNDRRDLVRGIVLDAPAADLREIVDIRSGEALPVGGPLGDSLLAAGRLFTSLRTGLDFDEVDYVDRLDEIGVPILLFHGQADTRIPFEIGTDMHAARPDLVEFVPVSDAAHIRSWNEGPDEFDRRLTDFLERIGRVGG